MAFRIKFNVVWDKLKPDRFNPGTVLTTTRRFNPGDLHYYNNGLNMPFIVELSSEHVKRPAIIGGAMLRDLYQIDNASELTLEFIQTDTFKVWRRPDFYKYLERIYGRWDVPLMVLTFEVTGVANGG